MREIVTRGTVCLDDEYGFTYCIAEIRYTEREDESFRYEISPHYSVIGLLTERDFQGIPGLDLSLRKKHMCGKISFRYLSVKDRPEKTGRICGNCWKRAICSI